MDRARRSRRSKAGTAWAAQAAAAALMALAAGCGGDSSSLSSSSAESCMQCHNASLTNDYSGPGIENPHPFGAASNLRCTQCHGGNGNGDGELTSHVPPPPEIGDDANLQVNNVAYFNRLTQTGIDKFPNYIVDGRTYSALDYLQFINPGDLRVVTQGRSCGQCHTGHAQCVADSPLATSTGIFSGATFSIGVDNVVPENVGRYEDTAADLGFRDETDPSHNPATAAIGAVGRVVEFPVMSVFGVTAPDSLFRNNAYDSTQLVNDLNPDNSVITGSKLADLYREQIAFTCGDCHLGSAGANNRYGDFRSSGCTSCHMQYSQSGRSGTGDPNVNAAEPVDVDQIQAPERSHPLRHLIRSTAKTLPGGEMVQGIDDYACAGCHQGSNRTVMQYWGIRLDQNQDVHNGRQYPANPASHVNTRFDTRLFDPVVDNDTFNGRNFRQYLLEEDYDNDGRDDTPPDIHYEAGLGCIDCHGSFDLHGGDVTNPNDGEVMSRMEQAVAIRCESCHGTVDAPAPTAAGTTYDGAPANLAVDSKGNRLRHVWRAADGNYYLKSRLTGQTHYVKQTVDTIVDSGRLNPLSAGPDPVYSAKASYAMGRADGSAATGIGPLQGGAPSGFQHSAADVSCVSCHASWTNSCVGCHLGGRYDENNNFSNITGERIVFEQANADFVYQSPVPFQLGIGSSNEIVPIAPNTDAFFQYEDRLDRDSPIFAFTDRNGGGANPVAGHPSLSHNAMMPHSIRGKVNIDNEGPRYCVACHLTNTGLAAFGAEYNTLRTAMSTGDYSTMDQTFFDLLRDHIGLNPGNRLNSPLWVHQVAGLGSGLFMFNDEGGALNLLDNFAGRVGSQGTSPKNSWNPNDVAFNLDRIVTEAGESTGSNSHPMQVVGTNRDGAANTNVAGPLGARLIERLTDPTTGIVLDGWLDADGTPQGTAVPILP